MTDNANHLSAALGLQVRKLRTSAGLRQDDVASAARAWGLDWTRSVVAAFESGRRQLAAEELLLLPPILRMLNVDVQLPDLLTEVGSVRIGTHRTIPGTKLAEVSRGEWRPSTLRVRLVGDRDQFRQSRLLGEEGEVSGAWELATRLMPKTKIPEYLPIEASASGEVEQRAARRLGTSDLVVAVVAYHLWGRSLTEERDARFAAASNETSPNSGKAARGWITRQLTAELETEISKVTEGT